MRKWMVLLILFVGLWACDDDKSNDQIQTSSDAVNFEQEGGEISILIKATADWNVDATDNWCFVQPDKEKGSFFVIASENESPVPRMTVLKVIAGNCIKEIDVVQEGSTESEFYLSENEASVYDLNDNYAVVVHSKEAWTARTAGNWFTIEPESGDAGVTLVRVQFPRNTLNVERQGKITFESKDGEVQEFDFKQEAALPDSRLQDSLALVAFYDAVHGDDFKNETFQNWKTGRLETWNGVKVTNNRVTSLILPDKVRVRGIIPEEIKYLSHLKDLNLLNSGVGGNIPKGLGRCVNLESCTIGEDGYSEAVGNISGSLPNSLCALQKLNLFTCKASHLGGVLPEVYANLSGLKALTLEKNALTGSLPVAWKYLTQVGYLYLASNSLAGEFPREWVSMKRITMLDLSGNEGLYGVMPAEIVTTASGYAGFVIIEGTNIVKE